MSANFAVSPAVTIGTLYGFHGCPFVTGVLSDALYLIISHRPVRYSDRG